MCNLCQLIYKYLKYNNGDYIDDQGGLPKVWVVGDHLFFFAHTRDHFFLLSFLVGVSCGI